MRKIPLTGKHGAGKFAVVDDLDYEYLSKFKWHINKGYPERTQYLNGDINHHRMHKVLIKAPKGYVVDHINGDKLDNRRANLRVCTQADNVKNQRIRSNNTSGYKGVSRAKTKGCWAAYLNINGRKTHLGYFDTALLAAKAYDYYVNKYNKDFAVLNFPNEIPEEPVRKKLTSRYKGVYFCKRDKVWRSQIKKGKSRYSLGSFQEEVDAARAYNRKALELNGEKASLNFIEGEESYENK